MNVVANDVEIALERARSSLTHGTSKDRVHVLWAYAKAARHLGEKDFLQSKFEHLAIETNLIDQRGYWTGNDVRESIRCFGAEDVRHVIDWALRGLNPFATGSLQ